MAKKNNLDMKYLPLHYIDHHVPHLLSPYYHHQNGHCVEDLNHHTHTTQNSDHQLPTQQVSGLLALYDY